MLVADDLLLLLLKSPYYIFKKIHDMAMEELEDTPEKLSRELLDLQMLSETEQISEDEYQKREKDILGRLDTLKNK